MRYIYQGVAKDGNGKVLQGATVSVYLAGTVTAAGVYAAESGGVAVNSVLTDSSDGSFLFWVDDTEYTSWNLFKISISKTNFRTNTFDNLVILPEIDAFYPDYTAADQGVTGDSNTLKYYIDTAGSDNATIILRHNSGLATTTYTFATNETIPDNILLKVEVGAIIDGVAGGGTETLVINGSLNAGAYQIFGENLTVQVAEGAYKLANWWGVDDAAAQRAIDCWETSYGTLEFTGMHTWANGVTAYFDDPGGELEYRKYLNFTGSRIQSNLSSGNMLTIQANAFVTNISINGLMVQGNGSEDGGLVLDGGSSANGSLSSWVVRDVSFVDLGGDGISVINNCFEGSFHNVSARLGDFNTTGYGFKIDNETFGVVSSVYFYNCATRQGLYGLNAVTPVDDIHIYGGTFITAQKEGILIENGQNVGIYGPHVENNWESAVDIASGGAGIRLVGDGVISAIRATTNSKMKYAVSLFVSSGRATIVEPCQTSGSIVTDILADGGSGSNLRVIGETTTIEVKAGSPIVINRDGSDKRENVTGITSGTTETDLATFTVPAKVAVEGSAYSVFARGDISGVVSTKTIRVYIGANSVIILNNYSGQGRWYVNFNAYQIGSNFYYDYTTYVENSLERAFAGSLVNDPDITYDVKITGECANAGDTVSQDFFTLTYK